MPAYNQLRCCFKVLFGCWGNGVLRPNSKGGALKFFCDCSKSTVPYSWKNLLSSQPFLLFLGGSVGSHENWKENFFLPPQKGSENKKLSGKIKQETGNPNSFRFSHFFLLSLQYFLPGLFPFLTYRIREPLFKVAGSTCSAYGLFSPKAFLVSILSSTGGKAKGLAPLFSSHLILRYFRQDAQIVKERKCRKYEFASIIHGLSKLPQFSKIPQRDKAMRQNSCFRSLKSRD